MKTGYSFGSLVSFTEALNASAVKITGDQTIAGLKTFSSNPVTSAAQGSGGGYLTRKDYVDGALALKAPLASPALTGVPTAPTAAADTSTTQIATTAFVTSANTAQLANVAPLMDGVAEVGTSKLLARQDHKHPTDTSRAPLASPALTGTPTAPTVAQFDNNTTLATTAFVQRALGNKQGYVYIGDGTLAVSDAGKLVWFAGAGTLVLPPTSSLPRGAEYTIMCTGGGKIITANGDSFYDVFGGRSVGGSLDALVGDVLSLTNIVDGWQYRGVQIPTAATNSRSTRPASTAFVRNYLESSPQLAGVVHVEGTVNVTGEYQTTNATGYRMAYGDYGTFWHQDQSNIYLMLTNKGVNWGSFNNLRPFCVNLANGRVGMGNGVSVAGGLVVDDGLTVTGGVVFNHYLNTKQYVYVDGGWWRDSQPYTIDGNYACSAVYDVSFNQLPTTDSFFPIIGAAATTANEGYQARVKFGVYSAGNKGGWERKHAGIWVGNGENNLGPKYLYKFNAYGRIDCADVVASTSLSAGTGVFAQYLVSSVTDAPGLRLIGGPYGTLFHNDSSESFYLLLTNANDQMGGFNNLRPFILNRRTGSIQIRHGLTVAAGLWTDQAHISSATNSAPTQAAGTNNTTIATTAFVNTAVDTAIDSRQTYNTLYSHDPGATSVTVSIPSWCRSITIVMAETSSAHIATGELPYAFMKLCPSKTLSVDNADGSDWLVAYTLTGNSLNLKSTARGVIYAIYANR